MSAERKDKEDNSGNVQSSSLSTKLVWFWRGIVGRDGSISTIDRLSSLLLLAELSLRIFVGRFWSKTLSKASVAGWFVSPNPLSIVGCGTCRELVFMVALSCG